MAKIADDNRNLDNPKLRDHVTRHLRDHWTLAKIAVLPTDVIESQLSAYGVAYDRAQFLTMVVGRASAWSIADDWQQQNHLNCKGKEVDFLGLAACELWKRLAPEPPSVEMLDDWMQDGYRLEREGGRAQACDIWWQFWQALVPRFVPHIDTMEEAEAVFVGMQSIFNWSQDFADCLRQVVRDRPDLAARGEQFCREWLAQFAAEGDLVLANFMQAHAAFQFHTGAVTDGWATLDAIPLRWPDDPWSYVRVADAHAGFDGVRHLTRDLAKAEAILRAGLARIPAGTPDRDVIEERLAEIDAIRRPTLHR